MVVLSAMAILVVVEISLLARSNFFGDVVSN